MFAKLKRRKTWKALLQIATWILVLVLIGHPELRLLVPILDTVGLEVLVGLASLQFLDLYRERFSPFVSLFARKYFYPAVVNLAQALSLPQARRTSQLAWETLLTGSGPVGTALSLRLVALHHTAQSAGRI